MDQAILYVDVENLQDIAKQAVRAAIECWPETFPRPGILKLYVKADQTELWKMWAAHSMPSLDVQVKGVQHYTFNGSKSTADMSLALDALADLIMGRTKHIAIMSDDSDYFTLFSAVKENGFSANSGSAFRWFMTDRSDTRSQLLIDFFPGEFIHTVPNSLISSFSLNGNHKDNPRDNHYIRDNRAIIIRDNIKDNVIKNTFKDSVVNDAVKDSIVNDAIKDSIVNDSIKDSVKDNVQDTVQGAVQEIVKEPAKEPAAGDSFSEEEKIARAIIENLPAGMFRSADCKKVISRLFPKHKLSTADSAKYGLHFSRDIWPILERYGVLLPNPNRKPRKYELTEEAKKKVAGV